jgi:hypothetical protein
MPSKATVAGGLRTARKAYTYATVLGRHLWPEIISENLLNRPGACFRQGSVRQAGFVEGHETGMGIILAQNVWESWS